MANSGWGKAIALARCCHPEPTAAVTTLTTALALFAGRGPGSVWVAAAVLAGQLSVGWANDYLDRDVDMRAGRMEKPIAAGRIAATTVRNASIVALALAVPLSLASGLPAALVHFAALALAHLYNLALKSTILSIVPYALAFSLLPAFVTLGLGPRAHWPAWWIMVAAGALGSAGHFTQVLPDLQSDAGVGVRGLPQVLGAGGSLAATAALLVAGSLIAALGPGRSLSLPVIAALATTLVVVAGVVIAGARGSATTAFRLTIVAAGLALLTFLASGSGML